MFFLPIHNRVSEKGGKHSLELEASTRLRNSEVCLRQEVCSTAPWMKGLDPRSVRVREREKKGKADLYSVISLTIPPSKGQAIAVASHPLLP